MGFACDFEGAGFVFKLPVLTISKTKFAKHQKQKNKLSLFQRGVAESRGG